MIGQNNMKAKPGDLKGPNIGYLQMEDIDERGNLKHVATAGKPVIIMFQSSWCGHCKTAKPEFQKFADMNKGKVTCITVQADEPAQDELSKKMMSALGIGGFPSYKWFVGGRYMDHNSGRKMEDLNRALQEFM